MNEKYILAPKAASNLINIWRRLKREAGEHTADRVESEIRSRIEFIAKNPGVGHFRRDLSSRDVKIYPAYSWLIIYRPNTRPLQVVSILHGRRDVANILKRQTN